MFTEINKTEKHNAFKQLTLYINKFQRDETICRYLFPAKSL